MAHKAFLGCEEKPELRDLSRLVPIQEFYWGDVSEPLGDLTKHPSIELLELYK